MTRCFFADGKNIRNQKSNLGSWSYCQSFEGIPADSYGQNECNRFNKVNGTKTYMQQGDTCIQLTDENFPQGHPQVA
jgi:NADH dehydrogenase